MRNSFSWLLLLLLFLSCKKDDTNIIYGYEYFPVDSGHFVTYDVVDIFHDEALLKHDTDRYQLKEVIGEELVDLEGDTIKKLYRYIRDADTLNWQLKDVWTVKKTNRSVEVVEENKRKIKMAFSISYDQYWDCNALNNEEEEQCYYRDIYEPILVGDIQYDSSVVVEHQDFSSFIEYLRHYEVYARNVGRIQLYKKNLEINNGDTLNIQKGTELFYTAIDYGQ